MPASRARAASATALAVFATLCSMPAAARAQDVVPGSRAPIPEAPAEHVVVPPRLLRFVEAQRPPGHEGTEAAVVLTIVVSAEGAVESVEVVESAGDELDVAVLEAVLEAVRRFEFAPATRDGAPMRARIRYRYELTVIEAAPEPAPAEAPDADVTADEAVATDEAADPEAEPEEVEAPEDDGSVAFRATAVVEPMPRDAGSRTIDAEIIRRIPGTRGDALRAVEILPGVGRPAFGLGQLIVRGAAPSDSQVFLGGNPVPLVYHFGGLTSFYNSQLLDSITFVPGNFSLRYGRRVGGILEVEPRDPRTDRVHGFAELSAIDASISIEAPIDEHFGIALAVRRSTIDLVLAALASGGAFEGPIAAPVYYDYQAIASWRPDGDNRIRFGVYGSVDELRLFQSQDASDDASSTSGSFGLVQQFHRVQVDWRHLYSPTVRHDITLGIGLDLDEIGIGNVFRFDRRVAPIQARAEWRVDVTDAVHLIAGLDLQILPTTFDLRLPQSQGNGGFGGMGGPGGGDRTTRATFDGAIVHPAVYVESDTTIAGVLDVALGARLDYFGNIQRASADPRGTARLRLGESWAVRAGVGLFSQPPQFQETTIGLGNPSLGPTRALHLGAGVDFRLREEGLTLQVDGFYKHVDDVVVATPDGQAPFYTNDGIGRIYGLELSARLQPGTSVPLFGFFSYTLMRSERLDRPGEAWRVSDYDQTHILSCALVWEVGGGFEIGATFRLVSGNPYTPVVGAVNDLDASTYRPIYGATNSARNPFFHRLDVRLQQRIVIRDFRLVIFLDVQNVYNATNREGVQYSYDYTETADISGIPFFPSLGIRGEL
ncbi:MAG: TonB-dependent receptor [Myxococcota bacterium]|nr:TonB-dependent receptor [Myxococcota bacterium]